MDTGQWIIIVLSVFMGAWYVVGMAINRRRGIATYHWLREGLQTFGKVTEARWIGSSGSGARLAVGEARSPFRRVEVVFLLDSREILPLWLVNLLRGKQDEMILKANLRRPPKTAYEIARQGDGNFEKLLAGEVQRPFTTSPGPAGFTIARRGSEEGAAVEELTALLERYPEAILRLSLQRGSPHLILRLALPSLREEPAGKIFSLLKDWVA